MSCTLHIVKRQYTALICSVFVCLYGKTAAGVHCNVTLNMTVEAQVGFITLPEHQEGDFNVCFLDLDLSTHSLTFHFHEFYIALSSVSLCPKIRWYLLGADYVDEEDVELRCMIYGPSSCNINAPITTAGYISITIPARHDCFYLPPDLFSDRPLFNITYDLRPTEMNESVINHLPQIDIDYCNLNGVPTIYKDQRGTYSVGCECRDNTSGDQCQWGGDCLRSNNSEICSNHGHCRYQAGKIVCFCDEDYIGTQCEYHNQNLLWDVTVQFDDKHNTTSVKSLKTKIQKLLDQAGLPGNTQIDTPPNRSSGVVKAHFTVKDTLISKLPPEDKWVESFNSSVILEKQNRSLIISALKLLHFDAYLELQCSSIGELPMLFTLYKDGHLVYLLNVTSSSQRLDSELIKGSVDRSDSNGMLYKMDLFILNPDSTVDLGTYTCEVTNQNGAANSTLVNVFALPFEIEVTPKIITVEKNANLSLLCTTRNNWNAGTNYFMAWKISPDDAVDYFVPQSQYWNGSYISLYNIKKSLNLTCTAKEKLCGGRNSSVVSRVLVLRPGDLHCPFNSAYSIDWPPTAVGEMSEVLCPSGFYGKCSRKCHEDGNKTAVWALPDCSTCIYSPLMEIDSDPEVILQARGYPIAIQDASAIAEKFLSILHSRTVSILHGELHGILILLQKFIYTNQNPVSPYKFMEILEVIVRMFTPSIQCGQTLHEMATKFIKLAMEQEHHWRPIVEFQDVGAHVEWGLAKNSSLHMKTSRGVHCGSLAVEISRVDENINDNILLNVGVLSYLQPRLILGNITDSGSILSDGEMPIVLLDAPLVEVMTVIVNGTKSSFLTNYFGSHFTYNNYQTAEKVVQNRYTDRYNWSKACGQIKYKGGAKFHWDLSKCSHAVEEQDVFKCQCRGQGLFGLFMTASFTGKFELPRGGMSIVAVACCTALLMLLAVSLIVLVYWLPEITMKLSAKRLGKRNHVEWEDLSANQTSIGIMDSNPGERESAEQVHYSENYYYMPSTNKPRNQNDDPHLSSAIRDKTLKCSNKVTKNGIHNESSSSDVCQVSLIGKDNILSADHSSAQEFPKAVLFMKKKVNKLESATVVYETDNGYMEMDSNSQVEAVNKVKSKGRHTYTNVACKCYTPTKCELGAERKNSDTNSVGDDGQWVLSTKDDQQLYLPMTTKKVSCK